MTALELERLYAEEWPTGSFGGPRPVTCQWCRRPIPADTATWWDDQPQCPNPHRCPPRTSPASAARHYADLETAIRRQAIRRPTRKAA